MTQITEIPNTPWRDALMPASYRGAQFHVEAASQENGRRIVMHQFPKRDIPYAEDMGREAFTFTVRAYCIAYPFNTDQRLYQRDYRISRNALIEQLEQEGMGDLQLPLLPSMKVVVQKYRVTEEQKTGGYCTFDITFAEAGKALPPFEDTRGKVIDASGKLKLQTIKLQNGKRYMTSAKPVSASLPSIIEP
jgi:prophage DNA circulation protein